VADKSQPTDKHGDLIAKLRREAGMMMAPEVEPEIRAVLGDVAGAMVQAAEAIEKLTSRSAERDQISINGGSEQGLRQSRDADKAKGTPALAAENEGATSAIASPSSARPFNPLLAEQLAGTASLLEDFAVKVKQPPSNGYTEPRSIECAVWDRCEAGGEAVDSFELEDGEAEAIAALIRAALAPCDTVRYCAGCGSVGDVPNTFRDCCPDGSSMSCYIPRKIAEQCHGTFRAAIAEITKVAPTSATSAHIAMPAIEDESYPYRFRDGHVVDTRGRRVTVPDVGIAQLLNTIVELRGELRASREMYHELLYAVGKKWPGETRHQTALRYIQQAERGSDQASSAKAEGAAK
jgi:hypothetical protein